MTAVWLWHLRSGEAAYLGVAVQAVHIELRGAGHHEVALTVIEEVAVHGKLQPGGRVCLLVHRVHVAATVTPEPPTRGNRDGSGLGPAARANPATKFRVSAPALSARTRLLGGPT